MVFGDYVIEGNHYRFDSDDETTVNADAGGRTGSEVGLESNIMNVFFLLTAFGQSGYVDLGQSRQPETTNFHSLDGSGGLGHASSVLGLDSSDRDDGSSDENGNGGGMSLASRLRRHGRVLLGRSGRRRMHREAQRGGG